MTPPGSTSATASSTPTAQPSTSAAPSEGSTYRWWGQPRLASPSCPAIRPAPLSPQDRGDAADRPTRLFFTAAVLTNPRVDRLEFAAVSTTAANRPPARPPTC